DSEAVFARLRLLHGEGSALVDRTTGQTFATNTICGDVNSLSPFVIALSNLPPVTKVKNVTVEVGDFCTATLKATDIDDGSFDPDGDDITFVLDSVGPFNPGQYVVTETVIDKYGASSSSTTTVNVVDRTPPTLACPANIIRTTEPGKCSSVVNYT